MGISQFFKSVFSQNTEAPKESDVSAHTVPVKEASQPKVAASPVKTAPINFDEIIAEALRQTADQRYWYSNKAADYPVFQAVVMQLTDSEKVAFTLQQIRNIGTWRESSRDRFTVAGEEVSKKSHIASAFIDQLFRSKIEMTEHDISNLVSAFIRCKRYAGGHIMYWPIKDLIGIAQKLYKGKPLPNETKDALIAVKTELLKNKDINYDKQSAKVIEQIDAIIFIGADDTAIKPVLFLGQDDFAAYANQLITALPDAEKPYWYKLITLCQKAGGATPSKKLLTDGNALMVELGTSKFKTMMGAWFSFIVKLKEKRVDHPYLVQYGFITPVNVECLKGFIWLCINLTDAALLQLVAALADKAYRKIPGHGQTCTAIGNASAYALYKSEGLDGINHLSRLKLRVKQLNTQTLIEKYLVQAAADRNIPPDAIEDLAVDDFGLINGAFKTVMEGFTALVTIEKVGKVNLVWQKADGSIQKSDPAVVKEKCADELKKLKADVKQIEASLATQRDRLDRSLRADRKMNWLHFEQYYFQHGLVSFIARKMIWRFTRGEVFFDALYLDGKWTTAIGERFEPTADDTITLWHPAINTSENVQRWRLLLIDKQIQQPIKQAFREIYLLTDAEINTRTYSNRMAGHILKQHQLNSLAKGRSWRYALQGGFDGGSEGAAQLLMPQYNLVAEYWINGVGDDFNDTGIFNYVSTDQVRFKNLQTNAVELLIDVPVLAFSEAMRDVDLFVGVASVGNDPTWRDSGGLPGYRDYWQQYAFGDLNEMSKGRKQILERLLPRLKIAKVAHLIDKFLVVKGKKRTYKIHMGSTNILMEPNDQYLCIVPDRNQKSVTENVFLPFEGDNGLSIILSKAFLLADDDKITDVTITRQIDR